MKFLKVFYVLSSGNRNNTLQYTYIITKQRYSYQLLKLQVYNNLIH